MELNQFHCFRSGCWCHANKGGGIKAETESYYERKVRLGLIDRKDALTDTDIDWQKRDALIYKYRKYPSIIAKKLYGLIKDKTSITYMELFQEGQKALIKYAAKVKGNSGSAYLYKSIKGYMKIYIRQNCKTGIIGIDHRSFWAIVNGVHQFNRQKDIEDYNFLTHYIDSFDKQLYTNDTESSAEVETYHDIVPAKTKTPEELLVNKQEAIALKQEASKVKRFYNLLDYNEKIVFQKYMIAKTPMTTRDLAIRLGVKSPQTITNIRDKIIEKAKEYFKC